VYLGRDTKTKKKQYITRTIHGTKHQAEEILNELLVEAGHGSHAIVDGTVGDLAQQWLALASPSLSPTTDAEYRRLLDRLILPRFSKLKVRSLTAAKLDSFYADLQHRGGQGGGPLGAQSVQHVHALIRRLLNQAVKWGWIMANPASNASPPRVPKHELHLPSAHDVVRVLADADERDPDLGCFLRLAVVTGARRGELCALRWRDLDSGTVHIGRSVVGSRTDSLTEKDTKTHATRRIALDTVTLKALDAHRDRCSERATSCGATLDPSAFLFSGSADGTIPWRPGRVTLAFVRLCEGLKIDRVRLHDLRHFAATQLLAAGVPVKTVSGRLGHADAATTLNVYAHFLESSDEEAAKALANILDTPTAPATKKSQSAQPHSGSQKQRD